ncbi:putative porin [Verrucomicrobiota bacterium]
MKKSMMMCVVLGLMVSAGVAKADDKAELKSLQEQLKLQKQELVKLLAKMEQLEKSQSATQAEVKDMSWTSDVKVKADLRYRYEHVQTDDSLSKDRQRIRARIGLSGKVNDEVKAGFRIATGAGANSGNDTLDDNWADKSIYLDLAYMTYSPEQVDGLDVTIGKMKKPWYVATDLIWDGDVNPEGVAANYETAAGDVELFTTAGYMILDDQDESTDWEMFAGQVGGETKLSDNTKLTLAGSVFSYQNSDEVGVDLDGNPLSEDYTVLQGTAALGVSEMLPVPVKFYVDAVTNVDADEEENGYYAGVKFGDANKADWEVKVDYRELEANAAPDLFVDSDFAGGGTDVKGFRVKSKYNLSKNFQVGATYIMGENGSEDVDTLHLDLISKF